VDVPKDDITNLSGNLLVAHPALRDPNFRRSILFISAHGAEIGALGVIINRPTNHCLADLATSELAEGLERVPVFHGGPVGTQDVSLLCFRWMKESIGVQANLGIEEAAEVMRAGTGEIRAYRGYAGWSPGQLETELQQQAWIVLPAQQRVFAEVNDGQLWYRTVSSLGPAFHLLAQAPDDPSLN
jgi:putative transcriptional regulator